MTIESRASHMTILAMVQSGSHEIVVDQDWLGKITIRYDDRQLTDNPRSDFTFQVNEEGERVEYRVWFVGRGWSKVNVTRDGALIFSTKDGFVPPKGYDVRLHAETDSPQKEIVVREREVILVVCPHCGHRNDVSRRTCEKCNASI